MANRLGRSFYRFSSVNRPGPPPVGPTTDTTRDSTAQYDGGRQFASMIPKDQPATEPSSPRRTYSPVRESPPPSPTYSTKKAASPRRPPHSPTRESLPTSPTFSTKKAASPPSSPTYRPTSSRPITSPPKPLPEYSPKFKQTQPRSPPEADRKPVIYKSVEKSTKSDRHLDSGKSSHNNKQQPNAIRIAGENIGAVMEIVQSPNKREGGGHILRKKETRGIHHNNVGHENDEASKEKGSRKGKEANDNNTLPTSTFMNSNFQTVNNSLLYNASINHHDPGLHLSFSRKPTRNRSSIEEEKKHFES